jgi:hypothetical protein
MFGSDAERLWNSRKELWSLHGSLHHLAFCLYHNTNGVMASIEVV